MDMGRFLIETHLRTGRPIKELAGAHDVSAGWLFKLLRRYRLEGPRVWRHARDDRTGPPRASPMSTRTRSWRCTRSWPTTESMPVRPRSTTTWRSVTGAPVDLHHLPGSQGPGVRRPLTPEAPEELVQTVRGRCAERDLAGRHDPCRVRGRSGLRGAQHD